MKFFIKDFFSKCDQILKKLRVWSHLLKKSLMENFIFFCSVTFNPNRDKIKVVYAIMTNFMESLCSDD